MSLFENYPNCPRCGEKPSQKEDLQSYGCSCSKSFKEKDFLNTRAWHNRCRHLKRPKMKLLADYRKKRMKAMQHEIDRLSAELARAKHTIDLLNKAVVD